MRTVVLIAALVGAALVVRGGEAKLKLKSPDGKIILEISSGPHLNYEVRFDGQKVVERSPVGIVVDTVDMGEKAAFAGRPLISTINEVYPIYGAHTVATNHCFATVIPMVKGCAHWELDVHMYNDGVAYRYRVPGTGRRHIEGETSSWIIPIGTTIWSQSANNTSYESRFDVDIVGQMPENLQIMAPAVLKFAKDAGFALLTEADLSTTATCHWWLREILLMLSFAITQMGGIPELADSRDTTNAFVRSEKLAEAKDVLTVPLRKDGGYVAWLRRTEP